MIEIVDTPDFYGSAIFCDDIRQEADGKITYVGAYSGTMYVAATFPINIAKFAIQISFSQRKALFTPKIGVRIFMPGDDDNNPEGASIQAELQETQDGEALRVLNEKSPDSETMKYISMNTHAMFTPLQIKQAGSIKVRVLRENKLYKLSALAVRHPPGFIDPIASGQSPPDVPAPS